MAQTPAQWQLDQNILKLTGHLIEIRCPHCGRMLSNGNQLKLSWNAR